MPDVITLGELIIDFVSTKEDVSLKDAPGFTKAPGGAPANVAVGVVRLGRTAGFIGKVGDDPFGHYLADVVQSAGVDISNMSYSKEARTALALIAVLSDGSKDLFFYRNPGADMTLSPSDFDDDYIRSAKAFHFGSISLIDESPREATLHAVNVAKDAGLLISYDPNYRPSLWPSEQEARERMPSVFEYCDVVKISDEEWEVVTGTEDFDKGCDKVLAAGPKLVIISMGEKGCTYKTASGSGQIEPYQVEVAETIGAGDGFTAALLVRLLDELDAGQSLDTIPNDKIESILRFANAVGALTCTKVGAIPALPTREEAEAFVQ
ncbi:MAG: carbohydrate kinase [Planctomycetes bacterium]|nr:carbohydrate kinase [Planctomycetota bacterium]